MSTKADVAVGLFRGAFRTCIARGYGPEIDCVKNRRFEDQIPESLLREYVYVVLNAGMKNQVAERIYKNWLVNGIKAVGHPGKKKAIADIQSRYAKVFKRLKEINNIEDRLIFLESLPWIGEITKYHLARNLGMDVAKPDRHLVKLSEAVGFADVQEMCIFVSLRTGCRVGVVDVVLWRYCNLRGIDSVLGELDDI